MMPRVKPAAAMSSSNVGAAEGQLSQCAPIRAVYDGGQTVHVTAIAGRDGPVFIDLIRDGQTMLTASVPVIRGRGEYALDLPPELFGTIELSAYRYSQLRLSQIQNRVIYVHPAGSLKIDTKLDKPEYRAGTARS